MTLGGPQSALGSRESALGSRWPPLGCSRQSKSEPSTFSGHSLRAGLVTAAAKARKSIAAIQEQTAGHRSVAMVQRYVRDADLFDDNASDGLL